eukprot:TRINITY_DN2030_c0_g1_i5.p1 TRINITY_DN2030_c0_g1~~TRINITY_DN2030_c0_g1_i5.p1  ORF type:complete len:138 (-),score=20.02 TRINITY_DN2030_c0_g1_i5:503-916(-)
MYDVDGNGVIDQDEMTKIVQAIYDMLGAGAVKPTDTAEERAKNIFNRMDENNDGSLTEEEFLKGCLQDDELSKNVGTQCGYIDCNGVRASVSLIVGKLEWCCSHRLAIDNFLTPAKNLEKQISWDDEPSIKCIFSAI